MFKQSYKQIPVNEDAAKNKLLPGRLCHCVRA